MMRRHRRPASQEPIPALLGRFFHPATASELVIRERRFPDHIRPDLQRAVEELLADGFQIEQFCGIAKEYHSAIDSYKLSDLFIAGDHPARSTVPSYSDIDIGDEQPVRCVENGLWLLRRTGERLALLLAPMTNIGRCGYEVCLGVQMAAEATPAGQSLVDELHAALEKSVERSRAYRGKILSFEGGNEYRGTAGGLKVHRLRTVERDQVVLPRATLELLERNVLRFTAQRARLRQLGLPTKKGLLFYGPPGTGKTHTIHYLIRELVGHTTLLISAEQVGLLSDYMTIARLLQPSIVVIEDADLIARERTRMGVSEELLLNKLLNEMDGLREDADILFVLTTNRPEAIEKALAARPGRIDQAIEFPLPDAEGRAKLVRLYAAGAQLDDGLVDDIAARTERTSAAFIKELMRRALQFHFERNGTGRVELPDVASALDEMLFSGGSLNRTLLGGDPVPTACERS